MNTQETPGVFIGFNPDSSCEFLMQIVRSLAENVRVLGARILVHKTCRKFIRSAEASSLLTLSRRGTICVFLTPSLDGEDHFLSALLFQAMKANLPRYGFIVKEAGKTRLVTPMTFKVFDNSQTDVTNAVCSHKDVISWIRGEFEERKIKVRRH